MAAFGTVFMPQMIQARFEDKAWGEFATVPSDKLEFHAGAHVLHYSSTCFEGLKAFRHEDGSVYIFRMDANIKRMQQSSQLLSLPDFDATMLEKMIIDLLLCSGPGAGHIIRISELIGAGGCLTYICGSFFVVKMARARSSRYKLKRFESFAFLY